MTITVRLVGQAVGQLFALKWEISIPKIQNKKMLHPLFGRSIICYPFSTITKINWSFINGIFNRITRFSRLLIKLLIYFSFSDALLNGFHCVIILLALILLSFYSLYIYRDSDVYHRII